MLIEPAPQLDAAVRAATDISRRCTWYLAQSEIPVETLARMIDALQDAFTSAATALGRLRSAATDEEIQKRLATLALNPPANFAATFDAARAAGLEAVATYAAIHAAQGGRTVTFNVETGKHDYVSFSARDLAALTPKIQALAAALAPVTRA